MGAGALGEAKLVRGSWRGVAPGRQLRGHMHGTGCRVHHLRPSTSQAPRHACPPTRPQPHHPSPHHPPTQLEGGQEPGGREDVEGRLVQNVEHNVEGIPKRAEEEGWAGREGWSGRGTCLAAHTSSFLVADTSRMRFQQGGSSIFPFHTHQRKT